MNRFNHAGDYQGSTCFLGGEGIDTLRNVVNMFNSCHESFNQTFSAEELIKLYVAYTQCEWDITPDEWTDEQIEAAIDGVVPTFEGQ